MHALPPPPMNDFNAQQAAMAVNSMPQQSMHMTPGTAVPMSDVQFDIAGLSSELALWEFPTAITWNEWNPYLHGQQQ